MINREDDLNRETPPNSALPISLPVPKFFWRPVPAPPHPRPIWLFCKLLIISDAVFQTVEDGFEFLGPIQPRQFSLRLDLGSDKNFIVNRRPEV